MRIKGIISVLLSIIIVLSAISCTSGGNGDPIVTTVTGITTAPPEEDDTVKLYYDDRKAISEIIGKEASVVEIKDQQVTSKKVGSDAADENVLIYEADRGRIIAVGVGSAVIVADGEEFEIKVDPAPISMIAIIGHSMGMGSKGTPIDSVLCEEGWAYSTYLGGSMNDKGSFSTVLSDDLTTLKAEGVGLGYASSKRPYAIDFLTPAGIGRQGTDGGIASSWIEHTGEKVWIVNAAVGGASVMQWINGSFSHNLAVEIFNDAANILKNEVAAGHYDFKEYAMINFSSANFGYQNVVNDDEILYKSNLSMWNGFKEKCNVDIDGDGKADPPTSLGYVTHGSDNGWDRDIIAYMAASAEYPDIYVASKHAGLWTTDDKIKSTFPKDEYKTHRAEPPARPTTRDELLADATHYKQAGYNGWGLLIGEAMYDFLRTDNLPNKVYFEDLNAKRITSMTVKSDQSKPLVIVAANTTGANFDIQVSDNLEYTKYGMIKGLAKGEGTVTVLKGDKVLGTIKVTVN